MKSPKNSAKDAIVSLPKMYWLSGVSISAYSLSGATARARLLGSVQGVVVHARILVEVGAPFSLNKSNATVTAGS